MSTQLATLTTIVGEIALALHPILIKEIPTNLSTQLLSRIGTYSVIGLLLSSQQERTWTWGTKLSALKSVGLGVINLIHIATSYLSYTLLPAGSALALFYTYPFINILAGVLFLGDSLDLKIIPLMIVAFVGVLLIAKYTKDGNGKDGKDGDAKDGKDGDAKDGGDGDAKDGKDGDAKDADGKDGGDGDKKKKEGLNGINIKDNKSVLLGVLMSLAAAITETMLFMVAKSSEGPSPVIALLRLYPAALLGIIGWVFMKGETVSTESSVWIPMLLFNVFIGFLGYFLRFFSIPRLPTAFYSILTFVGVSAGYIWGVVYANEIPSAGALTGAALITGSIGILKYIK